MHLDIPTLLAVEAFISGVAATMIIVGCPRGPRQQGCLWWMLGGFSTALALVLFLMGIEGKSEGPLVADRLAFALSPAFYWTGARVFAGKSPSYPLMLAGFGFIAFVSFAPGVVLPDNWLLAASFAVTAIYLLSGALELARSEEAISARWVLAGLLAVHGLLFVAGTAEAIAGQISVTSLPPLTTWFGLIHFESIVFAVGSAVFVIAFVREQGEARQRRMAEVDGLTGASTRRAFFGAMGDALDRSRAGDLPLSIVVFDLDHFKSINDGHGHVVGDKVLKLFADTVRASLRRGDRIGRIGGEEFALMLPETGLAGALEVAERVRATFEQAGKSIDGAALDATVSGGVAVSSPVDTVQSLLIAADDGLYEAKAKGRNRVERASSKPKRVRPTTLRVA